MAVELADGVPGLEIGQAEADKDVRTADDQDRQVQEVEQERERGRERRDHQDHGGDEQLELADHRADPACRFDRGLGVRRRGGAARRGPQVRRPTWIDELVLMINRWARAGSARVLMSSGIT